MRDVLTHGVDHVGLTVSSLARSVNFFVDGLGWTEKGGKPDYPASYVSDGKIMLTLWQVEQPEHYNRFDRRNSVGLHHLALGVNSAEDLDAIFLKIKDWEGVQVEFAPEFSGAGPKRHCMITEPGGNRIEFAWDPRKS